MLYSFHGLWSDLLSNVSSQGLCLSGSRAGLAHAGALVHGEGGLGREEGRRGGRRGTRPQLRLRGLQPGCRFSALPLGARASPGLQSQPRVGLRLPDTEPERAGRFQTRVWRGQGRGRSPGTKDNFVKLNLIKKQTTFKTNLKSVNVHPLRTRFSVHDAVPSKSILLWLEQLCSMEMPLIRFLCSSQTGSSGWCVYFPDSLDCMKTGSCT